MGGVPTEELERVSNARSRFAVRGSINVRRRRAPSTGRAFCVHHIQLG
jgi:hypothetical protein